MDTASQIQTQQQQQPPLLAAFELRFESISGGIGCAFPCDAVGRVDMDSLSSCLRVSYLAARALVGYQFRKAVVGQLLH